MVLSMKVQEYLREDGSSPYQEWFDTLDIYAATKVSTAIVRLELGNTSNIKWFDGIGELKIDYGPGYRIYLVQQGQELIILFGGGTKKTQQSDIENAKNLYQEYKHRKKQILNQEKAQKRHKNKKRGKYGRN